MFCNSLGSVSSPWAGTRTLEASPAGLTNFTVEQREQGRSLLLSWDQPSAPNGVITVHTIHTTKTQNTYTSMYNYLHSNCPAPEVSTVKHTHYPVLFFRSRCITCTVRGTWSSVGYRATSCFVVWSHGALIL